MAHELKAGILSLGFLVATPPNSALAQEQPESPNVLATDGTFSVRIPPGWQTVVQPTFYSFVSVSDKGESFWAGLTQVYTNQMMMEYNLRGFQLLGVPQALLALMARLVSSPLPAEGVIGQLLPQIGGRAMAELRVLQSHPMPSVPGTELRLIHYQYTLLPQQDRPYPAVFHPALLAQDVVPMEGIAVIWILAPATTAFSWYYLGETVEAPQPIFRANRATYARIFRSFQYIPQGLALLIRTNAERQRLADAMNETNRRVGQTISAGLGPTVQYPAPGAPDGMVEGYPAPMGKQAYSCPNESPWALDFPPGRPGYADCRPL